MRTTKTAATLFGVLVGGALCASGQGLLNSNFEQATIVPSQFGYPLLDWNTAVPGWSHSTGSDTSIVYWGTTHVGISQCYLLMDATSPWYAPGTQLAGNYSLAFSSGHLDNNDFFSPWVNAYISQTVTVPSDTLSLRMLAIGPFQVLVGGVAVPMFSLGGNSYGADISSFAGSLVEVKIMNTATSLGNATVVDNILFSPTAVPEPSGVALLASGALLFLCRRYKNAA